jgi:hypothetical protein
VIQCVRPLSPLQHPQPRYGARAGRLVIVTGLARLAREMSPRDNDGGLENSRKQWRPLGMAFRNKGDHLPEVKYVLVTWVTRLLSLALARRGTRSRAASERD